MQTYNRLGRMAAWCGEHRRLVVSLWVAALVLVTALSMAFPGVFNDNFGGGHSESNRAQTLLHDRFPTQAGDSAQIVFHTTDPVISPANQAAIARTIAAVQGLPHVASVRGPFDPGAAAQISRDGHIAYAVIQFDQTTNNLPKTGIQKVVDRARATAHPGFEVLLGGPPISKTEKVSPGSSEAIGILAAVIILLLAFGSVIAMGLPILTALFGVALAFGIIDFMSHGLVVPTFGSELAAMIGIGVGIDYALFIVTRYRQGLHDRLSPAAATVTSLATSGRAVLFAGSTVVISLLGMFLLGLPFIYGLALGAIAAVILVMACALTLLPALLGFAGRAIDRFHVPRFFHHGEDTGHTLAWRWSRVVQRRPWLAGGSALAILIVLALPLFSMQQAFTDQGNGSTKLMTRQAYDFLATGFGPGSNGPLVVAVDGPPGATLPVAERLQSELSSTPGVAFVSPPQLNAAGDTAVVIVVPTTSPQDAHTIHLVHTLRSRIIPGVTAQTGVRALVGGETAAAVDAAHHLSSRLPIVIGAVVLLSFLLLMAVFRSIAVPIKAAVMNLLSVGAAYGVIVAVFQWGWGGSIIGIGRTGPIDPWIPLMLFTILFGLSMDYEVFLLSRIREEWRRTGDNALAVADGLAATARVITAAAAIMVCVFGSFVLSDIRVLKLFGLGLAVAVFLDATLVRMVLVPSTMELLGNANWWFPGWLDRIVPTISVEVEPASAPLAPSVSGDGYEPVLVGSDGAGVARR
jgi:RND superfamily putative drug exporter